MTKNPRLRRVIVALVISAVLTVALMVFVAAYDFTKHPVTKIQKIVDAWGRPGDLFATSLIPIGHDFAYLVGAPLLGVIFIVVFYAALAWFILSFRDLWRKRWRGFRAD